MYVTTNKVASVLPIMISADRPQNNLKERNRQRTRTVIRVISCSANFTKCPFTLLTFSRFLSASPYSSDFFTPFLLTLRNRASLSERTTFGTQSWAMYVTCSLSFLMKTKIPQEDISILKRLMNHRDINVLF